MTETSLQGRVAVVTGASRGIGYFLSRALAAEGVHVIAVARTVGGLEDLDDEIKAAGGSATLVPLDLTDYDGLDRLGAAIYERWGKLDMLVGNAGMLGGLSPLGHVDIKTWDKVMALNVTANWRLIRSLDPLLRQSDAGRAVFLTSSAAHKCKAFWGPYSASKAALEALVRTYAAETRSMGVCANLLNPGAMRTAMRAKAMPGEDPETLPHPAEVAPQIIRLLRPDFTDTGRLYDRPSDSFKDYEPLVV
ncbi:SDR family NAD(P)-dependent oxidoreductase [Microvirga tunisiensis]|uniref:SDR family NAD(P)-dependent oxidoreductase n=2 Tax=Pannonibacter tanglangensis TaxID=2750084 RepID=A0ABW9ZI07_9HYPH|nr:MULTISPECIES: SDR family NAD(P)-dependent oxidoreductase [unclassified Pannonibacter]NBN64074.1 SDR family NAD(P)-dependent oxidoreductase [Pannonibacter sp. XCT-34]NBN77715.1 SDR family NAD(P)-dependent oxidoreductase [Pannonibacter sp. XCT-53]